MTFISVFNDVLGPVKRGPSSSHTAGSYQIGRIARSLLGGEPDSATLTFDPEGSYANVYQQQGVDLAFSAGLMRWSITDIRFPEALQEAASRGIELNFKIEPIDAVYAVGQMLPSELRCTALAGLSQTPSAKALVRKV